MYFGGKLTVARLGLIGLMLLGCCCTVWADFLVAWRDSYKVCRYDSSWTYMGDFAVFPNGTRVLNVVQDRDTGDVYVRVTTDISSPTAGTVIKFDQFGNLVPGWSVTGLSYGKGLAVRQGRVFIADATAETLKWYSTTDSSVGHSLSSGSDPMGPVAALAFDSQGKLFAAGGGTIKRWGADLTYQGIVVGDSANLTDVKIMPGTDGIRALRWDGYLLGWDNDGNWTGPYYRHPPPPWPQAIWISPGGEFYRSAAATGGIQKLDPATAAWQTIVPETTGFVYPMGFTDFGIYLPELRVIALLEDYIGDPSLIVMRVDVLRGGSVVESRTLMPGTVQPTLSFILDPGTYTVRVAAGKWVSREVEVTLPPGQGRHTVSLSLPNGDVDGDGYVGSVDFSILSGNYGQSGD